MILPIFKAVLVNKKIVASEAYIYRFELTEGGELNFLPGQYVWLILSKLDYPDSRGERRAFSIISSNQQKSCFEILVRNSESGFKRTLAKLNEGTKVDFIGPLGHSFIIPKDNQNDMVFIAGGVAIAPFLSFVNSLNAKPKFKVRMFHFMSSSAKACQIDQLIPNFNTLGVEVVDGYGPFSKDKLTKDLKYSSDHFYTSGPQGFVNAVGILLDEKKVPLEHRHFEENYPEPDENLTEEKLKNEANTIMMRAIMDSKSHTIITDANGKIIFANPKAEQSTGYKFSEMCGNTPRLWGGMMSSNFYQTLWKNKQQIGGFDGELVNRRKDGTLYTVMAHISPITTGKSQVVGYIGTEEDITLVREQQSKMELQNDQLQKMNKAIVNVLEDLETTKKKLETDRVQDAALLSSLGEGIVATDKAGNTLLINKVAEQLLGFSLTDISGRKFHEMIPMMDSKSELISFEESPLQVAISKQQRIFTSDLEVLAKGTRKFPVALTAAPIFLGTDLVGAVEVFRDISHEKEVSRMKTEFISLASHQLKTPLTAIKWFAEMLLAGDAGNLSDQQREFSLNIEQSTNRMIDLVNSLLNVSRIESGRIIIDPQLTNLQKLIGEVISELQSKLAEKKLNLVLNINDNLPEISVDPKLIRQVYSNLLTNAVKYTKVEGKIVVSVAIKDEEIVSQVSDNGYGIPLYQQEKLFTKFFRADNVLKVEPEGTGLGLYLIKAIVESSGGKIGFESKGEGKGSSFWFSLPIMGSKPKSGEVSIDS